MVCGRVHTLEAPVVADMADLYRGIDGGACATLLAKLAVEKAYGARLDETRSALAHKVGLALREYRLALSAGGARDDDDLPVETAHRVPPDPVVITSAV